RVLARADRAVRGRDRRLHPGVLAARFAVRPAHRRADRTARHPTRTGLPRRGPRRRRVPEPQPEQRSDEVSELAIRDLQVSVKLPGVSVANFLRTAKTAIDGQAPKLRTWGGELKGAMERLGMDPAFAQRNVNEGFSGGEKKRHEIVQLELLKPRIAILDETD